MYIQEQYVFRCKAINCKFSQSTENR